MSKEALLVVDMQEGYLLEKERNDRLNKTATIAHMIFKFRSSHNQVHYTGSIFPYRDLTYWPIEITPYSACEFTEKKYSDGFKNTDLLSKLNGVEVLHVVGCNAEACVIETIDSALRLQLQIIAYPNAIMAQNSSKDVLNKTLDLLSTTPGVELRTWYKYP